MVGVKGGAFIGRTILTNRFQPVRIRIVGGAGALLNRFRLANGNCRGDAPLRKLRTELRGGDCQVETSQAGSYKRSIIGMFRGNAHGEGETMRERKSFKEKTGEGSRLRSSRKARTKDLCEAEGRSS